MEENNDEGMKAVERIFVDAKDLNATNGLLAMFRWVSVCVSECVMILKKHYTSPNSLFIDVNLALT